MNKDGREVETTSKNYQNYIYIFRYRGNVFAESLKVGTQFETTALGCWKLLSEAELGRNPTGPQFFNMFFFLKNRVTCRELYVYCVKQIYNCREIKSKGTYLHLHCVRLQGCRVGVSGDKLSTSSDIVLPGGLHKWYSLVAPFG
jgi:hypothetical protein